MRTWVLAAVGILALDVAALARAPAGLGATFPVACASGYHTDAGGNCQPNVEQANRYCPTGTVFHPSFDSWSCDPPPREAY
jgi:hypothetical protein